VALNLTTVDPRTAGFLTAYDCDGPVPLISNHNFVRDEIVAHSAIVPVSATGEVCIYNSAGTNLVVDLTGRFTAAAGLGDAAESRLVDTRDRGTRQPAQTPLAVDVTDGDATPSPVALTITVVAGGTVRQHVDDVDGQHEWAVPGSQRGGRDAGRRRHDLRHGVGRQPHRGRSLRVVLHRSPTRRPQA
jgi:hypothetical protein